MATGRLRPATQLKRSLVLVPVWAWLITFVALPALIVVGLSFAEPADSIPPYKPLLSIEPAGLALHWVVDNYQTIVDDNYYFQAAVKSLIIASISSLLCLLFAFPIALAIVRSPTRWQSGLLLLIMLPFWTGFLLRILAWVGILGDGGWINAAMIYTGLTRSPLHLLYTPEAMYIGIVYCYLPFMVLPIYSRLSRFDYSFEEAAADLGARPMVIFWNVTLPLAIPGVVAGIALVFMPVIGEYVIPELLGGPSAQTIGRALWNEFFENHDWPMAAAVANILLVVLLVPLAVVRSVERKL